MQDFRTDPDFPEERTATDVSRDAPEDVIDSDAFGDVSGDAGEAAAPPAAARPASAEPAERNLPPLPHVVIHAYCDNAATADAVRESAADRLMMRARCEAYEGGIDAAALKYANAPSPDLLILETTLSGEALFGKLEELAERCDVGTKVVVIGYENDVGLYKNLVERGVEEYVVGPVSSLEIISVVASIYSAASSEQALGKIYAVVGAKGGVGASVLAHNIAWAVSSQVESKVLLADLDLPFGTSALNFDLDPTKGTADVVSYGNQIDDTLLDRLITRYKDRLCILAPPSTIDKPYDLPEDVYSPLFDLARAQFPTTILDIPHTWTSWARSALVAADQVIVVAEQDLANLKGAKAIIDFLKKARPNDPYPKLVLNRVGTPKRPEVDHADFAKALQVDLLARVGYDPQAFGVALNAGQPLAESAPRAPAVGVIDDIAEFLMNRSGEPVRPHKRRRSLFKTLLGAGRSAKRKGRTE